MDNDHHYDRLVIGAGISGLLAATLLRQRFPGERIAVVEREYVAGGKLRATNQLTGQWSYGLGMVSGSLVKFLNATCNSDPENSLDLTQYVQPLSQLAILTGGKLIQVPELNGPRIIKALGGNAAVRDWQTIEAYLQDSGKDQPLQNVGVQHKSPAGVVLEHLASLLGLPTPWNASRRIVAAKWDTFLNNTYIGNWHELVSVLRMPLHLISGTYVLQAKRIEGTWTITTNRGVLTTRHLVACTSPWEAIQWLEHLSMPVEVLNVGLKTKPVSAVVASFVFERAELPQLTLIPSEGVQVWHTYEGELCVQATIDYELSLQAPAVEKALRRIRRATQRLRELNPALKLIQEHVALVPVAWGQICDFQDQVSLRKCARHLSDIEGLSFVGESYGDEAHSDDNLIQSARVLLGAKVFDECQTD